MLLLQNLFLQYHYEYIHEIQFFQKQYTSHAICTIPTP